MKRTKLIDRLLPDYTNGEEIFNMVTHIVGGGFGVVYLVLCVVFAALKGNVWGVVSSAIYGGSVIALFTMSSVLSSLFKISSDVTLNIFDKAIILSMVGWV